MKLSEFYADARTQIDAGYIGFGTNVYQVPWVRYAGVQVDLGPNDSWIVRVEPGDQDGWPHVSNAYACDGTYEGFLVAYGAACAGAIAQIAREAVNERSA